MKKINIDIRKLILKNPFILAPMDDVTDIAFRELCELRGASYTVSELTSINALVRDKVFDYRYKRGGLKINCVQLFGGDVDIFIEAVKKIEKDVDIIDINFGCPSPRVMSNDAGSNLLKNPKKVGDIVRGVVGCVDVPVTAKIRLGIDENDLTYIEVAKEIEEAGACLITVHGRTAKQKYGGVANWDAIKEVYDALSIPVVGNGDICSEEDVDKYLGSYCDALMIGRAAIGDSLIFKRLLHYYKTGSKLEYDLKSAKKKEFLEYIKRMKKYDYSKKLFKIKHQAMWFIKGIEGVREVRREIMDVNSCDEVLEIIKKF